MTVEYDAASGVENYATISIVSTAVTVDVAGDMVVGEEVIVKLLQREGSSIDNRRGNVKAKV